MASLHPAPPKSPVHGVSRPIHSTNDQVQASVHYQCSGLKTRKSSDSNGDAQSLGLTSQAVSPHDASQLSDRDEAISGTVSNHSENSQETLSQTLDSDILESASQVPMVCTHAAVPEATKQIQEPSSTSLVTASSASTGTQSLAHDCDETKITSRPCVFDSLGLWTCVIIAGGSALTLAVLGFLIFLWFGEGTAGGESATFVWRKIMLSESWPAQTITICSLVLRTVATAQAAVCTSLVAALLLERRWLPLSKVVPVSIKRGVNDGPLDLLRDVLSKKYLKLLFSAEMVLLLIVAMVTSGIQFTSTVLLSGFDTTTLVEFPQELHHNVLLSAERVNKNVINSYAQFPPSYAIFGELETFDTPDPNPLGVSDTGVKLRSFLPFQEQQRTKLRSYTGPAFSERTQVMCMRPNMDARVSFVEVTTEYVTMPSTSISGTISYEKTFEEATLNNWTPCSSSQQVDGINQTVCFPKNFSCTLPLTNLMTIDPLPVIALCHLSAEIVGNISTTTPSLNMQVWNESNPLWSANANSWIYLTLSTNLSMSGVIEEIGAKENLSVPLDTPIATAGEWQTYQVFPDMALNVTLCFAGLQTHLHNVSMSSATEPKEPKVQWDPVHLEDGVEPGQVFMGTTASRLSAAERGIPSITEIKSPSGLKPEDTDGSVHTLWRGPSGFMGMFAGQPGGSWIMCNVCCWMDGWSIPPDIAALFARTIHTTGRAGWAIQNFLTTYTESWYAQILPQFDVAADIDVTFSTQLRIPRHWGGLIAALVMVIANLVCVWAITLLYVIHTRYSRQGNVWHTVSQIMSEDTRLVLEQSNQVLDKDVEKRLKIDDYLVFIGKPKDSEKVSVLRS